MDTNTKKWLLIAACAAYVICPLDMDFIPFLGWVDDLMVVLLTRYQIKQWSAADQATAMPLVIDHVKQE